MTTMKRSLAVLLLGAPAALGFTAPPALPCRSPHPPAPPLSMAKRGKGLSIDGGGNNKLNKPQSLSGPAPAADDKAPFWVPTTITSIKSLPQETNVVQMVETGVPALVNKGTNPTGAVAIVNRDGATYCFASACAACKIPMTKAQVLEPTEETGTDARLACDFCGSTYNLRSGKPVAKEKGKLFGFLFSKSGEESMPVYGLGEQKGKVFINIP